MQWTAATAPGWARPLIDTKPRLLAEIAVFRASHGVEPTDTRITGPEQYRRRSTMAQNALRGGVNELLPGVDSVTRRWHRVVTTLDPRLTTDWFWPQLAWRIDEAARAGADVEVLLDRAMEAGGPLPDELPAAALWWRLAGSLTPVAAEATVNAEVPHPDESQFASEPWTLDLIFDADKPAELQAAQHSIEPCNIEADLNLLRLEVAAIEAAGSLSPATCYNPDFVVAPDPSIQMIAAAIADSDMSVQPLRCDTTTETHVALKGLSVAAARSGRKVLALPATAAAAVRADEDRYSHACFAATEGIPKLQSGQWKSPVGALIIVDDADHLTADQITWLMVNAGETNSQVVLATSHETTPGPSRHLTDALTENLPWSAGRHRSGGDSSTAISRITAYLNTVEHPQTNAETAAATLLGQLGASVARHRVLATPLHARLRAVPEPGRDVGLSL